MTAVLASCFLLKTKNSSIVLSFENSKRNHSANIYELARFILMSRWNIPAAFRSLDLRTTVR